MTAYVIVAIILALLCGFNKKKWPLFISFILLLFIGGFRDISVGTDTKHYSMLFYQYGQDVNSLYHANEPLYRLLQFFVASRGWGYETMQFITMFLILGTLYLYVIKASRNPHYSILCFYLLYFFFYSFNTIRQYLAIPLVLFSFSYLKENKWKKYILCLAVASLFHYVAVVGLFAFIFYKMELSKKIWNWALIITFVIGLTPFISSFADYISSHGYIYENYMTNDATRRESLFSISRLLLTTYVIVLVNVVKKLSNEMSILVLGICLLNIFAYNPVLGRIAQFFTIIQIIIIPNISFYIKQNKYASLLSYGSFAYVTITWIYLISANIAEVVPWKSCGFNIFNF